MSILSEERLSDSPYVEKVWRTVSYQPGNFTSIAVSHWEMVVTKYRGRIDIMVRGPETRATIAPAPPDAEFFGIQFKMGTFLSKFPATGLVDSGILLPEACSKTFWLDGAAWQFPTFENADTFVTRLNRGGLLHQDNVVADTLAGQVKDLSLRSVQRRFLRVTGLTHTVIEQINRARQAQALLEQGVSILDTVDRAGYADQPHLTRSLKRLIGQTPAQILKK
ncbi:MAG: hypothetical protein BGO39_17275 [Chloroflexi bacterium 54-19]|nr:MAG: hypothetical protein BGO39_17275 [Chloroflexi bacterium 54-19]